MKLAALLALLFVTPAFAFANGFDDLKTALALLQGQGVLRGIYEAKELRTEMEKDVAKPGSTGLASALVEDDTAGLQIRWDRALLKRAADEAMPLKGGKKSEVIAAAIGSSSGIQIAEAVNFAPRLLTMLTRSQLKRERAEPFQGKPARLLELNYPEHFAQEKVSLKNNSRTIQVWLGENNLPLGATITRAIKGSFMLFFSFENTSKEDLTFSVHANRLVLLRKVDQGSVKSSAGDNQYRNTYTFTPI